MRALPQYISFIAEIIWLRDFECIPTLCLIVVKTITNHEAYFPNRNGEICLTIKNTRFIIKLNARTKTVTKEATHDENACQNKTY